MDDLFWSNLILFAVWAAFFIALVFFLWAEYGAESLPPNAAELAEDCLRSEGVGQYFWAKRWKALQDTGQWGR